MLEHGELKLQVEFGPVSCLPDDREVKQGIRRNFARRTRSYDRHAEIQRRMAHGLVAAAGEPLAQAGRILEIGCGSGRDAQELYRRAGSYLGLDISPELVELARNKVSDARFEVADVMQYSFPSDLDAVFAFASLIHLDREDMKEILSRVAAALNPGGVLMLSMKRGEYRRVVKEDDFGVRIFYLHTPELIESLVPSNLEKVWTGQENLRGQDWFEIIFRKTDIV